MDVEYNKIRSIECIEEVDDYVYDISIKDGDPFFFGNDVLLHNTDSGYFSAYQIMKDRPEFEDFEWSKENVTELYDKIGDLTNESFPGFMKSAFNCPLENGKIIKASRELCAGKGLFITKKRYALLIYDKDNKRKDVNGSPGEIKAMGLDLKRSDTPKIVQDFLIDVLTSLLTDGNESNIYEKIDKFRTEFRSWPGWEKGSPKRANRITYYTSVADAQTDSSHGSQHIKKRITIPGHVLASINWNRLKKINADNYSMSIQDGAKVVVCKLLPNPTGLTSVAFPVDEGKLPNWFKSLPFDHEAMEAALIDKKIQNLLGVLQWKGLEEKNDTNFNDLFSF